MAHNYANGNMHLESSPCWNSTREANNYHETYATQGSIRTETLAGAVLTMLISQYERFTNLNHIPSFLQGCSTQAQHTDRVKWQHFLSSLEVYFPHHERRREAFYLESQVLQSLKNSAVKVWKSPAAFEAGLQNKTPS